MFSKMSLRGQILALCGLMAFFNGAVSVINFVVQNGVQHAFAAVGRDVAPNLAVATKLRGTFRQLNLDLRTLGIEGISEEESAKARALASDDLKVYEETEAKFLALDPLPGQREVRDEMKGEWESFKATALQLSELSKSHTAADRQKLNHFIFFEGPQAAALFQKHIDVVLQSASQASEAYEARAEVLDIRGNWINGLVSALGILFSIFAGIMFSSRLSSKLGDVVEHLSQGADGVAEATQKITRASTQLSSAATEQAASLQETAASIEEMSAMVKKNSENADGSRMVAGQSQAAAQKGKQVVDRMIEAIEEINQSNTEIMSQIEASNREISDIVRVISEIGNKTKVINDIVFQTKLLSFNASVEAARAGEHGKGFAVVAQEVGNLAQMSGNAAKEISQMLDGSIQKVETIVNETKQRVQRLVAVGREKVQGGTEVARQCGVVLDEIVANVEQTNQMTSEISEASREQAQGVSEINKAVGQLDEVTQQNANAALETSGAAEKLSAQADALRMSVADLTGTLYGRDGQVAARRTVESTANGAARLSGASHREKFGPAAFTSARKASVTPIRAASAKTAPAAVRASRPAAKLASSLGATNIRAINGEALPSENDPRFEDV